MDDVLDQIEAEQPLVPNKQLAVSVVISVLLHLALALILLTLFNGAPNQTASVTYIDLNAAQIPTPPMPAPAPEAAPAKPAPEPEMPQADQAPPQLTQAQETEPQPLQAPPAPAQQNQLPRTTLGLGLTKGYFKSLGEGETLRTEVREYYLELLRQINEKWWMDQQFDSKTIRPLVVNITLARNGEMINCEVAASSGNRHYDKAVQATLNSAGPFPPLPAGYMYNTFQAPVRLMPPLNLMAW